MTCEEIIDDLKRRMGWGKCKCGGGKPAMHSCGHCVAEAAIAALSEPQPACRHREALQRLVDADASKPPVETIPVWEAAAVVLREPCAPAGPGEEWELIHDHTYVGEDRATPGKDAEFRDVRYRKRSAGGEGRE